MDVFRVAGGLVAALGGVLLIGGLTTGDPGITIGSLVALAFGILLIAMREPVKRG